MPHITQRSHNPPVSPRSILPGELNHQLLDRLSAPFTPQGSTLLGAVELPRDQPPMPAEDRFRPDDLGHVGERLSPQTLADLGQADALRIAQTNSALDAVPEDPVFRGEVFVPKEKFP